MVLFDRRPAGRFAARGKRATCIVYFTTVTLSHDFIAVLQNADVKGNGLLAQPCFSAGKDVRVVVKAHFHAAGQNVLPHLGPPDAQMLHKGAGGVKRRYGAVIGLDAKRQKHDEFVRHGGQQELTSRFRVGGGGGHERIHVYRRVAGTLAWNRHQVGGFLAEFEKMRG